MRESRWLLLVACGAALVLLAASCGGGSEPLSGADQDLADAVEAELRAAPEELAFAVEADDIGCVAEAYVRALGGADGAAGYDLAVEGIGLNADLDGVALDQTDAEAAADNVLACIDADALLADDFVTSLGLDREVADCLVEGLDDDIIRAGLVANFMADEQAASRNQTELFTELQALFEPCNVEL